MSVDSGVAQLLAVRMGGEEIKQLSRTLPAIQLFDCLNDADDRVVRNAAWALTHKPLSDIRMLPQNDLIDLALSTPNDALRRLTLNLLEKQEMREEDLRTDFLDFCLHHAVMIDEHPGIQMLCLKLAHRMCQFYPELQHEFAETLSMVQIECYNPGMRSQFKKIMKDIYPLPVTNS